MHTSAVLNISTRISQILTIYIMITPESYTFTTISLISHINVKQWA